MQILTRSRRPRTGREIASALNVTSKDKQIVYKILHDLARHGEVKRLHGGKFTLPKQKRSVQGRLKLMRNGSGVVSVDGGREIRVSERALAGSLHGDKVEVVVSRGRNNRPEGRIVRIVERELKELVGLYKQEQGQGYVLPIETGVSTAVSISKKTPAGLRSDQIVVVQLDELSSAGKGLTGRVVEILGVADDPEVEMLVIARRFGIPTKFPEIVSNAAQQVQQSVSVAECSDRRDLRHLPFVTIDGETARDFDDAVTLSQELSGHYRLLVAIADVAHYVSENSPLDDEALQRGTSVYLPGTCLPMLPESLSNGICSLNPQVDRLVMVAEIVFDRNAVVIETAFCEAVICSQARLTYTQVQQFLDQEIDSKTVQPHLSQLTLMRVLASKLTRQRLKRGALDLEIPEAEIVLNEEGKPEDIIRLQRTMAHRIIEEFMLAANEAVAAFLTHHHFPLLYRVHEPPVEQDLEPFFKTVKRLGATVKQGGNSLLDRLQSVLASVTGDEERGILNRLLLRSLKQAFYHPENRGHFGLASEHYCHFTSPIRRYPDLLVHRMLKQMLSGADGERLLQHNKKKYSELAEQTSKAERRAIDAERDASAMKTCQFMVKHIGESYDGHVTSVHSFGFFVELNTVFVEGMVHVSSLGDTYYRFDEESSRLIGEGNHIVYEVGSQVTVYVRDVNVQRREIDFTIQQDRKSLNVSPAKRSRKRKR